MGIYYEGLLNQRVSEVFSGYAVFTLNQTGNLHIRAYLYELLNDPLSNTSCES